MSRPDQCSQCDAVAECLDSGVRTLEDASAVLYRSAPGLHAHLVQHDRDDLLRCLTYGGEPILPKVEETTVVMPPPVEVEERSCECDRWAFDPGEEGRHEAEVDGVMWLHTEEACAPLDDPRPKTSDLLGIIDHTHVYIPQLVCDCGEISDVVDAEIIDDPADWLDTLIAGDDPEIREAAAALTVLLAKREQDVAARAELERLTSERDRLTARIEELSASLGGQPTPDRSCACGETDLAGENTSRVSGHVSHSRADCEPLVSSTGPLTSAQLRTWCREHDVPCPATGRVPRVVIEAYEAAHGVSAS